MALKKENTLGEKETHDDIKALNIEVVGATEINIDLLKSENENLQSKIIQLKTDLDESNSLIGKLKSEIDYLKGIGIDTIIEDSNDIEINRFSLNGEDFVFDKSCTKLQVNGRTYSVKEMLKREDILTTLVVGGNCFIKKI